MIKESVLYDFDDLLIEPDVVSNIKSRSEIKIYDSIGYLPLFTAPMDTVVSSENGNIEEFTNRKIRVTLPRTSTTKKISLDPTVWSSYSLQEFEEVYLNDEEGREEYKELPVFFVLIDIANGHMVRLLEAVEKAKDLYGKTIKLMVGNVANPETFAILAKAGADCVRVGIGNGGGCLTTVQTGVGYPMASLIDKCVTIKRNEGLTTKIVADGGMKNYDDIIKALALGADYVMLGSLFNKALESAAPNLVDVGSRHYISYERYVEQNSTAISKETLAKFKMKEMRPLSLEELMKQNSLYKQFRGMSTKEAQQALGVKKLKTSEGIVKYQKVEYTLDSWIENFSHYLRSAMSYTNSLNLDEFKNTTLNVVSQNAKNRFKK
jgi:IMP dehydrogenase/GMP reductase